MRSVILASLIACFTIDSIAFKSKKSYNYDFKLTVNGKIMHSKTRHK